MEWIKIDSKNYNDAISTVSQAIKDSKIVAYPTETFYGLGVRYDDEKALKRLYSIKKRDEEKTMPLIIGDLSQLDLLVESTNEIEDLLIKEFWPGPLTILFMAKGGFCDFIVRNGRVAIRLPSGSIAKDISYHAGLPITSTSANISEMPPAVDADSVSRYFPGSIDVLLDAGRTPGGNPSTIVEASKKGIIIVRQGVIDLEGFCKRFGIKRLKRRELRDEI